MYSIESYNEQSIQLTRSLVIKLFDTALAINRALESQGKRIPSDKKQWKYFMNLAGEKHASNSDVQTTIIELGTRKSLTKEILEQYPYTKVELLKFGESYKTLTYEFPNDLIYIHGCLMPVDKDVAIKAKDGTILNYNSNFIEDNEYGLIRELEEYIKAFLSRWHIKQYTIVDDLYLAGLIAVLYANIPNKINNIRMNNIFTNEVHSFHMEHFFRSNLNIQDEIYNLDNPTKFWLYKNLPYIINNIGKDNILNLIIDKLLTPNMIGIGTYDLKKPLPTLIEDPKADEPSFNIKYLTPVIQSKNSYYVTSGSSELDIETIITKELKLTNEEQTEEQKKANEYLVEEVSRDIKQSIRDNQSTKILELSSYQLFKRQGVDLFKVVIDNWIYSASKNQFGYMVEYIEPNDNKQYLVSPQVGLLMLVKVMLYIAKTPNKKIRYMWYDNIFNPEKDFLITASKKLYPDGYTSRLIKDLSDSYPNQNSYFSLVENFSSSIRNIMDYMSYWWLLDTNSNNGFVSANLKLLANWVTLKDKYDLKDDSYQSDEEDFTIDELLGMHNIVFDYNDTYNTDKSIKELLLKFTGINLDENEVIYNTQVSFKSILDKLTSYTVQTLLDSSSEETINLFYNNSNIMNTEQGILSLASGKFIPKEDNYAEIDTIGINFKDIYKTLTPSVKYIASAIDIPDKTVIGSGFNLDREANVYTSPIIYGYKLPNK